MKAAFKYLTDIPMGFWLSLFFIAAPIIVFSVSPSKNMWLRLGRLLLAIGFTYICLMLFLESERSQSWENYNQCYAAHSELRDMSPERSQACIHHLDRVPDSTAVFALLFGWVPSAGYVGFWELIWRIWHRKQIKEMGKNYNGQWFSNVIIAFFIVIGAYAIYISFPVLCHVASMDCSL